MVGGACVVVVVAVPFPASAAMYHLKPVLFLFLFDFRLYSLLLVRGSKLV